MRELKAKDGACGGMRFRMGITEEGIESEQWLLKRFRDKGIEVFQPDAISLENGKYVLNEMKHQELFKKPPFDGHGLPRWQIKARMNFYIATKIRCRLVIMEKPSDKIYWQWLDLLEKGEFFDTNGAKPRRIYNITSFKNVQ